MSSHYDTVLAVGFLFEEVDLEQMIDMNDIGVPLNADAEEIAERLVELNPGWEYWHACDYEHKEWSFYVFGPKTDIKDSSMSVFAMKPIHVAIFSQMETKLRGYGLSPEEPKVWALLNYG